MRKPSMMNTVALVLVAGFGFSTVGFSAPTARAKMAERLKAEPKAEGIRSALEQTEKEYSELEKSKDASKKAVAESAGRVLEKIERAVGASKSNEGVELLDGVIHQMAKFDPATAKGVEKFMDEVLEVASDKVTLKEAINEVLKRRGKTEKDLLECRNGI